MGALCLGYRACPPVLWGQRACPPLVREVAGLRNGGAGWPEFAAKTKTKQMLWMEVVLPLAADYDARRIESWSEKAQAI